MAQSGEGASGLYRGAQAGYFRSGAISFRHRERRFEFLEPVVRAAFQRTTFSASYLLPVHYEDNPCAKPPSERLQCAVPGYARPEGVAGQRYDDALSGSCGAVRQHRPRERPYPAAASRSGRDCRDSRIFGNPRTLSHAVTVREDPVAGHASRSRPDVDRRQGVVPAYAFRSGRPPRQRSYG